MSASAINRPSFVGKIKELVPNPLTVVAIYWNSIFIGAFTVILTLNAEYLAAQWGLTGTSGVMQVIAATGLGKAVGQPISGLFSDKFGRKKCFLLGCFIYVGYLSSMLVCTDMWVAYVLTAIAGAANAFIDNSAYPGVIESVPGASGSATVIMKIFFALGNILMSGLLAFMLIYGLDNIFTFYFFLGWVVISIIIGAVAKWPPTNRIRNISGQEVDESEVFHSKPKFSIEGLMLVIFGFTSYSTFYVAQQSFKIIGLDVLGMPEIEAGALMSYYGSGSIIAVLLIAVLIKKYIKSVSMLIICPIGSIAALLALYAFRTPDVAKVAAFFIGFFAAGGVFQLTIEVITKFFPKRKGFFGSMVSLTGSLAIFIMANLVAYYLKHDVMELILIECGITALGLICAVVINVRYRKVLKF